jgi:Ca2+-binding RTX toxin-like protein
LINKSWDELQDSVYSALVVQTRLRPYLDSIELVIDANGVSFSTVKLATLLNTVKAGNEGKALVDLVELNRYTHSTLQGVGFDGLSMLQQWMDALPAGSALRTTLAELDVYYVATTAGSARDDIWVGNASNNTFNGAAGDDIASGFAGDDCLDGGEGNDSVHGGEGNDDVNGGNGVDMVFGGAGNDTLSGASYYGMGNWLGDNDTLEGGLGNDTLIGGRGSDTYVFGRGDGQDLIMNYADSMNGYADPDSNKRDVLQFKAGILSTDVTLTRSGNDLIIKINGSTDQVTVQAYFVGEGVSLYGWVLEEVRFADGVVWNFAAVKAKAGVAVNGAVGNDNLVGSAGGDLIDGGTGADTMAGGLGDDVYLVDNATDVVNELTGQGMDTVVATVGHILAVNVENLILTGAAVINGTGNAQNNVLTGNNAANVLTGGAGDDTYVVGAGDTTIEAVGGGTDNVQSTVTWTLAAEVENLMLTGTAAINGTGNALNNILTGNTANNVLTGGAGVDTLRGGLGNDVYYLDNPGDTVSELMNEGTDTIYSSVSYTLGANQEHLVLNATTAINGTGNDLGNNLHSGAGSNVIDGGLGADTAVYSTASAGVTVSLALSTAQATGASGSDTLLSIENLTGSNFNDILTGNNSANLLNGGSGADTMVGGLGNDGYYIDNVGDVITELLNEGADTVYYYLNQHTTLGDNLESLYLFGTGAVNGTGNALNNALYAGAGNNVLDGGLGNDTVSYAYATSGVAVSLAVAGAQVTGGSGSDTLIGFENLSGGGYNDTLTGDATNNALNGSVGADRMVGGLGNDVYYVDNTGDVVTELANEGTVDVIYANLDYTLGANVENLYLTGSAAVGATGNDANNVVYGHANTAANVLAGGLGNDTYYLSTSDSVVENLNAGTDTVVAYVNFALGANTENLSSGVVTDLQLTGNLLNNVITGNAGKDGLSGGDGNDTLIGGAGVDALTGGLGADVFDFNLVTESNVGAAARDLITDFLAGTDRIDVSSIDANAAVAADQAFAFVGTGAFTTAGQLRFSFDGANTLVQGNIDAALGVDFEILLTGNQTLLAANFVL